MTEYACVGSSFSLPPSFACTICKLDLAKARLHAATVHVCLGIGWIALDHFCNESHGLSPLSLSHALSHLPHEQVALLLRASRRLQGKA
jgi:hypothetical protein